MTAVAISPLTKSSTERQLELTLNALARSMRKAIRQADKADGGGIGDLWKVVEHRCGLLQKMMAAAAQFMQALQGRSVPEPEASPTSTKDAAAPLADPVVCPANAASLAGADSIAHKPAPKVLTTTAQPFASEFVAPQFGLDSRLARFAYVRLQNLAPIGSPEAPAPEVDPRVRLLQLLTSRPIALQK